ncbi:MAG: YciI family protein [Actinobacteria bacterium]|nr:YciI family protein [Actinomycetota bacterium]
MKYMLLIYGDEAAMAQANPEQNHAVADEYEAFTQSIRSSGNFLDGDPFLPTTTATTVAADGGGVGSSGGPAVTTSPQLIAYYKVEADGPEQAIELAKRVPGAKYGSVEVRQVVQYD